MKLKSILLAGAVAVTAALPAAAQELGVSRINATVPFGRRRRQRYAGASIVFGGGRQDSADILTVLSFDLLGFDMKSIWGLERGGGRIGFERGASMSITRPPPPTCAACSRWWTVARRSP